MENTTPSDFFPPRQWLEKNAGYNVFPSYKMLLYHVKPIQRELIEAGAMAKVGDRVFLHGTRFWPEYQRIVASLVDKGGRE